MFVSCLVLFGEPFAFRQRIMGCGPWMTSQSPAASIASRIWVQSSRCTQPSRRAKLARRPGLTAALSALYMSCACRHSCECARCALPQCKVKCIVLGPGKIADGPSSGKTRRFIQLVEAYDPKTEAEALDRFFQDRGLYWNNEESVQERKDRLLQYYTAEYYTEAESRKILYSLTNMGLYLNDEDLLREYAPFIRALRDVFRKPQEDALEGFSF